MALPVLTFSLTAAGQPVSGIRFPVAATVVFTLTCLDPVARTAIDLTNLVAKLYLSALDLFAHPVEPPLMTKACTPVGAPTSGIATCTFLPSDTQSLSPGRYALDFWLSDPSGARLQLLSSQPELLASVGLS